MIRYFIIEVLILYIYILLLLLTLKVQVWCQNVSLTADQWCYHEGDDLTINATYSGEDKVGVVEWNFKPEVQSVNLGSGLNIRLPDCISLGQYPDYFPDRKRISFRCSRRTVLDSSPIMDPIKSHNEYTILLRVNHTAAKEMTYATWTVTVWLWNSLPLSTESVLIQDCKDKKWISSTTIVTQMISTDTTFPTDVSFATGTYLWYNKRSPYVLSPTDMYNIVGK